MSRIDWQALLLNQNNAPMLRTKKISAGHYLVDADAIEYRVIRTENNSPGYEWEAESQEVGAPVIYGRTKRDVLVQVRRFIQSQ